MRGPAQWARLKSHPYLVSENPNEDEHERNPGHQAGTSEAEGARHIYSKNSGSVLWDLKTGVIVAEWQVVKQHKQQGSKAEKVCVMRMVLLRKQKKRVEFRYWSLAKQGRYINPPPPFTRPFVLPLPLSDRFPIFAEHSLDKSVVQAGKTTGVNRYEYQGAAHTRPWRLSVGFDAMCWCCSRSSIWVWRVESNYYNYKTKKAATRVRSQVSLPTIYTILSNNNNNSWQTSKSNQGGPSVHAWRRKKKDRVCQIFT